MNVKVIALSKEQLQAAYNSLLTMAKHFPAILEKANHEGRGIQDGKSCRAVLITAANACLTLYSTMSKGNETLKAAQESSAAIEIDGTDGIRERLKLAIKFKTGGRVEELERLTSRNYGTDVNLLLKEMERLGTERNAAVKRAEAAEAD